MDQIVAGMLHIAIAIAIGSERSGRCERTARDPASSSERVSKYNITIRNVALR